MGWGRGEEWGGRDERQRRGLNVNANDRFRDKSAAFARFITNYLHSSRFISRKSGPDEGKRNFNGPINATAGDQPREIRVYHRHAEPRFIDDK